MDVLIIEDNKGDVILLTKEIRSLFESADITTIGTVSEVNALHGAKAVFDLIISDNNLPDGASIDFSDKLSKMSDVVIIVSGSLADYRETFNHKISGFCVKPVTGKQISNIMEVAGCLKKTSA